jgi:predicted O-methyltransferase YrrM
MSAIAQVAHAVLPQRAIWEINRRLNRTWTRDIDLSRRAPIAHADVATLRDPARLEELLPEVGLNDDEPSWMADRLQPFLGSGLRLWQYPNQFAPYLALLARVTVRSYLEIGVQHGGSFTVTLTYLERLHGPLRTAVAADIAYAPGVARLARERAEVRQLVIDSASPEFREALEEHAPFDLVMIDGDHSYEATKRDFEDWSPHMAPDGTILFHDALLDAPWMTTDFGSARFVAELRASETPWQLVDSADSLAAFRRA